MQLAIILEKVTCHGLYIPITDYTVKQPMKETGKNIFWNTGIFRNMVGAAYPGKSMNGVHIKKNVIVSSYFMTSGTII